VRATPEISGAPGLTGLGTESAGSTGKGKAPTGGPHLSVAGRKGKGGRLGWAGEREWAGAWRFLGPRGKKEEGLDRAENERERAKSWFSIFESDSNTSIQNQIQRIQI